MGQFGRNAGALACMAVYSQPDIFILINQYQIRTYHAGRTGVAREGTCVPGNRLNGRVRRRRYFAIAGP